MIYLISIKSREYPYDIYILIKNPQQNGEIDVVITLIIMKNDSFQFKFEYCYLELIIKCACVYISRIIVRLQFFDVCLYTYTCIPLYKEYGLGNSFTM